MKFIFAALDLLFVLIGKGAEMVRELDKRTKQLLMDALQYSSNECN